jgi:hypothetical protein
MLAVAFAISSHAFHALARLSGSAWNPVQSLLLFTALGLFVALLVRRARAVPDGAGDAGSRAVAS